MWTFRRAEAELDEYEFRQVLGELNDLVCGYSGASNVNRIGIDDEVWKKLLRCGGLSEEGIRKLFAGESISQRDTVSAFAPFTVFTVHDIAEGDSSTLTEAEVDHFLQRSLLFFGHIDEAGVRKS